MESHDSGLRTFLFGCLVDNSGSTFIIHCGWRGWLLIPTKSTETFARMDMHHRHCLWKGTPVLASVVKLIALFAILAWA